MKIAINAVCVTKIKIGMISIQHLTEEIAENIKEQGFKNGL